ncbi:hypothetical protein [Sphingobacterium paucimobilis]|uniref:hypothetical protein n=1 Tax=Sphingobacterium paucimobilis TaxID=1385985 RepID=UPI00118250C0|nr:hypothetical protein [Sphingobacterium paucimobilis]
MGRYETDCPKNKIKSGSASRFIQRASTGDAVPMQICSGLVRLCVCLCSTGLRHRFDYPSSALRVRVEQQSNTTRSALEHVSNMSRSSPEQQSNSSRTRVEELSNKK